MILLLWRRENHFSTGNSGLLELRVEEIGRRYLDPCRARTFSYSTDEILVTVGGSEAIDIGFRTMLDPGDEVIIPEPCYVSYLPCVKLAGGVPVRLPLEEKDQFKLTKEKLLSRSLPIMTSRFWPFHFQITRQERS
ncbi:MAG: aminotransferase class I/II-fold pyridoxal phosphate-dependent enzyme [Eubacterium sp.]